MRFEQLAAQFGLVDRAAARRRVEHDLREFLRGAAGVHVAEILQLLDQIHADNWSDATANPPVFRAVDQVLGCHDRRAKLLGLYPEPDPTATTVATDDGTRENQPVLVTMTCSCEYPTCETGTCHLPKRPPKRTNTLANGAPMMTTPSTRG